MSGPRSRAPRSKGAIHLCAPEPLRVRSRSDGCPNRHSREGCPSRPVPQPKPRRDWPGGVRGFRPQETRPWPRVEHRSPKTERTLLFQLKASGDPLLTTVGHGVPKDFMTIGPRGLRPLWTLHHGTLAPHAPKGGRRRRTAIQARGTHQHVALPKGQAIKDRSTIDRITLRVPLKGQP
jgi:hypothetical protein